MANRKFVDNFIMIDAKKSVKYSTDLIAKFTPDYVIIRRTLENEEFYYAYKIKFFQMMKLSWLESFSKNEIDKMNLEYFLELHKWQKHEVLKTTINTKNPSDDPEIKDISNNTDSSKTTIVFKNNFPIGLLEANLKTEEHDKMELIYRSNQLKSTTDTDSINIKPKGIVRGVRRGSRPATRRGVRRGSRPATRRGSDPDSSKVVTKFATGTISDQLTINEKTELKIEIKNSAPFTNNSEPLRLVVQTDEERSSLNVLVSVEPRESLDFLDGEMKEIDVPLNHEEPKPLIFKINPLKKGYCTIFAKFIHKGNVVGDMGIKTKINTVQTPSNFISINQSVELNSKLIAPDLTISIIEERNDNNKYSFKILALSELVPARHKTFPKNGSWEMNCTEKYLQDTITSIDEYGWEEDEEGELIRKENITDEMIEQYVKDKTERLYTEILPPEFHEFFWGIKDRIKSIQIYTKDPFIPWEIIKPWNNNNGMKEEEKFLCEKYALTRWWDGIDRMEKTEIKKICVIQPKTTDLDNAKQELKWIKDFGNDKGIDVKRFSSWDDVTTGIKTGGFDLLHISTHGSFNKNNPTNSSIYLQDDVELAPDFFVGNTSSFETDHPLVIMNACETGQKGLPLSGLQGWANVFLNAKAFGFIGTLWSIGDRTAYEFTKEIYEKMNRGIPIDEAVRQARIAAKNEGDPSWLSYTLYSPANTPLKFGN